MVGVPRITGPEASLLHRSDELLERFLGLVHGHLKRYVPELWIRLLSTSQPTAILEHVGQRTDLLPRTRLAPDTTSAQESGNVCVEESGGLFEALFVVGLVRPLPVWVLVFGVDVAVDGLDKLLKAELDDSVRNAHASGCDALLRVVGGESPD